MMLLKRLVYIGLTTALVLLAQTARIRSETLEFPILTWASISDETGLQHILVEFGNLAELLGKQVLYAKFSVHADADTCVNEVWDVAVAPVASSWSAQSVSWDSPWDSVGGDFIWELEQGVVVHAGQSQHVEMLVTEVVRAWSSEAVATNGLILMPRESPCAMTLSSSAAYPGSGYGVLRVRVQQAPE